MSTPSDELAAIIAERLAAEGLLTDEDSSRFRPRLAEGKVKVEDWRIAIEKALMKGSDLE